MSVSIPSPRLTRRSARFAVLLLGSLFLPALASAQSDTATTQKQLQQLERDIKRISEKIGLANTQRDKLQKTLRNAEVKLGKLQQDMRGVEKAISTRETDLTKLQTQQQALEASRDEACEALAMATYMGGGPSYAYSAKALKA